MVFMPNQLHHIILHRINKGYLICFKLVKGHLNFSYVILILSAIKNCNNCSNLGDKKKNNITLKMSTICSNDFNSNNYMCHKQRGRALQCVIELQHQCTAIPSLTK